MKYIPFNFVCLFVYNRRNKRIEADNKIIVDRIYRKQLQKVNY